MAKLPYDKVLVRILDNILVSRDARKMNILTTDKGEELKFTDITQKNPYEETLLKEHSQDHHSSTKWVIKLSSAVIWNDVWNTVHNMLSTNKTKTVIWQQIHLNFYTQYSYNKWHRKQEECPLCHLIPKDIFHIILDCPFTNMIWNRIKPKLLTLHPHPVSKEEMAFGIPRKKQTTGTLLRNWITFMLRESIMYEERLAYHGSTKPKLITFMTKFDAYFEFEVRMKTLRYTNENRITFFENIITHNEALCRKKENGEYEIRSLFT